MLNWLGILLVFCSFIALAHFAFIIKYAVRTGIVITTAAFTLLIAIGLFSWAMMTTLLGSESYRPWMNIAYLCGLLAFPILIYLFIQRADSQSMIVTEAKGRIVLFAPLIAQLFTHYLLPISGSRFMDLIFIIGWICLTLIIWYRLYRKTQDIASDIMRDQTELMLSSFFVVVIYNIVIMFLVLSPDGVVQYGFIYVIGLTIALLNTVRGIVKYQLITGIELFYRNGLILMASSIFSLTIFIVLEIVFLSIVQDAGDNFQIFASAGIMIFIVLSMSTINGLATRLIETLSPSLKWKESQINEIFVMLDNGMVVAHTSQYDQADSIDRDLVGGMLSAIQNFLKEAFDASDKETLKSLRIGDKSMLVEHHENISIVLLFTGFEAKELRSDIIDLSHEIHGKYDRILQEWNGTMTDVQGIQDIVDAFIKEGGVGEN